MAPETNPTAPEQVAPYMAPTLLIGLGGVVSSSQSGSSSPSPTYTTPSSQSATDIQALSSGNTVQLDPHYDAVTFTASQGVQTVAAGTVHKENLNVRVGNTK